MLNRLILMAAIGVSGCFHKDGLVEMTYGIKPNGTYRTVISNGGSVDSDTKKSIDQSLKSFCKGGYNLKKVREVPEVSGIVPFFALFYAHSYYLYYDFECDGSEPETPKSTTNKKS